jgi:hypothetical protein
VNYRNKVIGVLVRVSGDAEKQTSNTPKEVMLPCFPSSPSTEFKTPVELRSMNEESIWTDYATTRDTLIEIHSTSNRTIPCLPRVKIMEDELVVGILTATNQFVQVMPPLKQIIDDGIPVEKMTNPNMADNEMATVGTRDTTRTEQMQRIRLENQFYSAFRSKIRTLLNDSENHSIRKSIVDIIESQTQLRKPKLIQLETQLRTLVSSQIVFVDIEFDILKELDEVNDCTNAAYLDSSSSSSSENENETEPTPYCLVKENGELQLTIPKTNLLSVPSQTATPDDNEQLYFMRMADELLRYNRVRMFMFEPHKYFNLVDVNYQINDTEFIITQSTLNSDTFADLVPFNSSSSYITNTNYDTANPAIHQTYADNIVSLDEQYEQPLPADTTNAECIQSVRNIVGNIESLWKRSFPNTARELVFKKTTECSYGVMMTIFQAYTGVPHSIAQIKTKLWEGYSRLIQKDRMNLFRFIDILNFQGKKKWMESVIQKRMTFDARIMSEEYHISDLDIWVLAHTYNLPIILFNPNNLKGFVSRKERALTPIMEWVICGGKSSEKYYFVRSMITSKDIQISGITQYQLVQPAIALNETKEFFKILEKAQDGDPKYKKNVWTIDEMLKEIQYIPKNS